MNASAEHYVGAAGEDDAGTKGVEHHFKECPPAAAGPAAVVCYTVGELLEDQAGPLIPILEEFKVDVYLAGHVHHYESECITCHPATVQTQQCSCIVQIRVLRYSDALLATAPPAASTEDYC